MRRLRYLVWKFSATECVIAVRRILQVCPGADIIYVHNAKGSVIAAVIRPGSEAWANMSVSNDPLYSHDHIEPGMF